MNDYASNSDHSGILLLRHIFTHFSHIVSILEANVYINNLDEWLLWGLLLPCYKNLKNSTFSKRLETASIELDFYKIQF